MGLPVSRNTFFGLERSTNAVVLEPFVTLKSANSTIVLRAPITASRLLEKMRRTGQPWAHIHIFGPADFRKSVENALAEAGLSYQCTSSKTHNPEALVGQFRQNVITVLDRTVKRVAAKIAFNYFAKCALPSYSDIVFSDTFKGLRNYILNDDSSYSGGEMVDPVLQERIILDGINLPMPSCGATIKLMREPYSGVSPQFQGYWMLAGYVNIYSIRTFKVMLGLDPFKTLNHYYLCGHYVNLSRVTKQMEEWKAIDISGKYVQPNDFKLVK